jgi:BASS family bile acid:Na+ symporter
VTRHGSALLAASIVAGVALAPLAAALRPVVAPAVALLMTLVLLRIDPIEALGWRRQPLLVPGLSAWVLLACPLAVFAVTRAAGLDGPLGAAPSGARPSKSEICARRLRKT